MSGFRFREYIPKNKYGEVIVSQEPPPPLLCHDDPDIKGSLAYDLQHGGYTLRWKNMEEVTSWRIQQEKSLSIELIHTAKRLPGDDMKHLWSEKHIYVCSRGPCRGKSNYVKKHNYIRKVPRKRIDCGCRLQFKIYPHTTEILGRYNDEHTHDTGRNNARFTRLRKETREEIERLLRLGVEPTNVLSQVQGDIYNESNIPNLIKTAKDAPPADSGISNDAFVLIIQTQYQRKCWDLHGSRLAAIDATHNTTHYENMSLFTLLVRDRWGHGMPAAWMVSSNGVGETIAYFLRSIRMQSPNIRPKHFMTDKDRAQMNAIESIYPESKILLCWWHVLHAWQQHFVISEHSELWELLKKWIRIQDIDGFNSCWEQIKAIAPPSVILYLETEWMKEQHLWSAVHRSGRTIFDDCDTNMLVEAWHHLLKGLFLEGKRNRRLDHLIYVLVSKAMPYFLHRHRRQELGFEGPDLEVKKRMEIEAISETVSPDHISTTEESDVYLVKSLRSDIQYRVDLDEYSCSCNAFPLIQFCKHICAVERNFTLPEVLEHPVSALSIHHPQSISPLPVSEPKNAMQQQSTPHPDKDVELINSLSQLAIMLQDTSLFNKMTSQHGETMENLHIALKTTLNAAKAIQNQTLGTDAIIPNKTADIAPNQHSWTETSAVMGVSVKSKRKQHTDPYSGGEKSGKKAKKDARGGKQNNPTPQLNMAPSAVPGLPFTPSQSFIPSNTLLSANTALQPDVFDPSSIDLSNLPSLQRLKRDKLYLLCNYYNMSMSATNADTIMRLHALRTTSQ